MARRKKAQQDKNSIAGRRTNRNVRSTYQRPVQTEEPEGTTSHGSTPTARPATTPAATPAATPVGTPATTVPESTRSPSTHTSSSRKATMLEAVERDSTRQQIQMTSNMVNKLIRDGGSRRACQGLLTKLDEMLAKTERLNLLVVDPADADEFSKQAEIQINLFTLIETIKEDVEEYVKIRADDPSSAGSVYSSSIRSVPASNSSQQQKPPPAEQLPKPAFFPDPTENTDPVDQQQSEKLLAEAQLKAAEAQQEAAQLLKKLEEANKKAELASKRVVNLSDMAVRRNSAPTIISGLHPDWHWKEAAINDWRRHSVSEPTLHDGEEDAPDGWIDRYCEGLEEPNWSYSNKAAATRGELPVYSGRAVDWFWWSDLLRSMVHDQRIAAGEKLAILKGRLRGDQLDIVQGLGGGESAYKAALSRLKQSAGRRDVMRVALLGELDRMELGRDATSFRRFAERARTIFFDLARIGEAFNVDLIERLSRKLHPADRLEWNSGRRAGLERRSLREFGEWLCERSSAYQNAYNLAAEQLSTSGGSGGSGQPRHRPPTGRAHHASTDPDSSDKSQHKVKCYCCEGEHRLTGCQTFKSMSMRDKIRFCVKRRLCLKCFGTRHSASECKFGKGCGVDGCPHTHHALLHEDKHVRGDGHHTSLSARADRMKVALGVIRTEAYTSDGELIPVSVMIDEGSNTTLFRDDFLRRLKITGTRRTLDLIGVTGAESYKSLRADVRFLLPNGEETIIAGWTIPQVARPTPVIDWENLKRRWAHLADVPVKESGGKIDVLLGLDHSHLVAVLESRVGGDDAPFASRTRLGWIVRGLLGADAGPMTARAHHLTSTAAGEEQAASGSSLDEDFKRFCTTEDFGTEFKGDGLSECDKIAEKIMDEGLKKLDVGYETPLTWREGEPAFQNNRQLALHRLENLKGSFEKDPKLAADYEKAINKYIDEGYASLVTDGDLFSDDQYYLTHQGVYKKVYGRREKKLRVVFDASARWRKKCLNDGFRPGRKLQNDLPKVLIRYQLGEITFAADVTAMYSRIRLRPQDARYHRFLWQKPGSDDVLTYQMDRLPFGTNCAPFIALKTIQRAASDASTGRKECMEAVAKNMYMDDLLGAADSEEEAVQKAKAIRDGLAEGDFHLTNWISNSPAVIAALQPETEEPTASSSLASDDVEKLLGVFYEPSTDELTYRVTGAEDVEWTRAGLLSKVASIYDPLGRAAPALVKAKIKLRELGSKGVSWKEAVPGVDKDWWQSWFKTLEKLNDVRMPRNLQPDKKNIACSELLTFGDASEEAYSAVVYLRSIYKNGTSKCRLVMAKTKLAPRRTQSIPKLELNAALLSARLANYVADALDIPGIKRIFFTDSSTTRNWIRAVASHYMPFVSHRIGEIQSLTDASEWRFVPGKLNIADAATRSIVIDGEPIPPRWFEGPAFLEQPMEEWPRDIPWVAINIEKRPVQIQHVVIKTPAPDLKNVIIDSSNLSACLKLEGEFRHLVRACQREEFAEDIDRLAKGRPLHRSSKLIQLSPFLDNDNVLRLGGRTRRAKLPYDVLHPPILPGKHPLSEKIVTALHNEYHHVGTDFLHSKVRQHFWILRGRELAKKIRFNCKACIKTRAKLATQKMGDLPAARLDSYTAPFTNIALDYFGPLETSSYRGRVTKRYGLLITCLVTRYTYLELVQSLSTPDFLYGFRRFIGEFTKPAKVFSDNGTNFVGAEKELAEAVRRLEKDDKLKEFAQSRSMIWKFQPPSAPHFGGSHEALVKSAKRALYRALEGEKEGLRYPTDEMLRTLLKEVSGLLNSRPLTLASNDPEDFRPLTPRDFLNLPPTNDLPVGETSRALPRDHVRYVKKMANLFWDLWTKTYLPTLVPRRKWTADERNFQVGDSVLLSETNLPSSKWKTGRVTKTFPGSDGFVRVVKVKTDEGEYLRPIHRLALLEPCSVDSSSTSGENVPAE